jgi:predicted SprT family Zn-dependent metalloprotease
MEISRSALGIGKQKRGRSKMLLEDKVKVLFKIHSKYLSGKGIPLELGKSKVDFGVYYPNKKIVISKEFLKIVPLEECEDTLLHEIAHHFAFMESGKCDHGKDWKLWCKILGCKPEQYHKLPFKYLPKGKYVGYCPEHGEQYQIHRLGKAWKRGDYICNHCDKTLKYKENV